MTNVPRVDFADAPRSAARDKTLMEDPDVGSAELPTLIGRAVTVNVAQQEVYARWRDLSQLQYFMAGVQRVEVLDARRARLVIGDHGDDHTEWDLEIIEEDAPRLIRWRNSERGEVGHEGKVEFARAHGGRGTVVTATLAIKGGGGTLSKWRARLFHRDPRVHAQRELRRFKQWVETGEISTSQPPFAAPRAS